FDIRDLGQTGRASSSHARTPTVNEPQTGVPTIFEGVTRKMRRASSAGRGYEGFMATEARDFPLAFAWRVEMARELALVPGPGLPEGCAFADWSASMVPALARIEHRAFAGSVDAQVFPEFLRSEKACQDVWRT